MFVELSFLKGSWGALLSVGGRYFRWGERYFRWGALLSVGGALLSVGGALLSVGGGRYFRWGGALLSDFNRKIKKLTLFSGGRYFRNSTVLPVFTATPSK